MGQQIHRCREIEIVDTIQIRKKGNGAKAWGTVGGKVLTSLGKMRKEGGEL